MKNAYESDETVMFFLSSKSTSYGEICIKISVINYLNKNLYDFLIIK